MVRILLVLGVVCATCGFSIVEKFFVMLVGTPGFPLVVLAAKSVLFIDFDLLKHLIIFGFIGFLRHVKISFSVFELRAE